MDRARIVAALEEMATLLELKGENQFKIRAYNNGARIIQNLDADLEELVKEGNLSNLRGIGRSLAEKITTMVETGSLPALEKLRDEIEPGLLEMLDLPGLGPKRVKALHDGLKVSSLGELEYACEENRLIELPGFGARSQAKVLESIGLFRKHRERTHYSRALELAEPLMAEMKALPGVQRGSIAGSLRRKMETVKDIDLLAAVAEVDRTAVGDWLAGHSQVEALVAQGPTKVSVVLADGINLDLRMVGVEVWGSALAHFTGSRDHNITMRQRAIDQGMRLSEWGLFKGDRRIAGTDEKELHGALGLSFIPPGLREANGEVEAAAEGRLPTLLDHGDIMGCLHNHTNWSDGNDTLDEMAQAAREMGWRWLGIADHSQAARYANGLDPQRLEEQISAIGELNDQLSSSASAESLGMTLLSGVEVDILVDGKLDLPDRILEELDHVVASIHSRFNLPEKEQTARLCRAASHPGVDIIGHPTGRLLLARPGYDVDLSKVIDTCAREGTAIEINASPRRLDLDWRYCRMAREKGVKLVINPDAHSTRTLDHVRYGVNVARKGWLERKNVLNCLSTDELFHWLSDRRQ